MNNCSKISELLSAYIDGEVSAKEKELVENHLLSCTSCKQKFDIMQKTKDILKDSPKMPVPETLLKDFEEYRKKAEQSEKKVVPLYKNYRIYASIAAVFVFAFVLKSGLWQQDKFMPDNLTQMPKSEQSIDAPIVTGNETSVAEKVPVVEEKKELTNKKKVEEKTVAPKTAVPENTAINSSEATTEVQPEAVENAPAVAEEDVAFGGGGGSGAAYDQSQEVSPLARTIEEPTIAEVPDHMIVYVAQEDLEKAEKLLSDGEYFYSQVEQKLNDNFIAFESNLLSIDEGIPHKVVVMVKE